MEFEKAKELFKKNTETMAAYSHAMGVLSYDSETAAPKNSAEGLGRTYGVLSEIIYKLTVNEEQFEVITGVPLAIASMIGRPNPS